MKKVCFIFLLFSSFAAIAQRSKDQMLEDSVIGWSNYTYRTGIKPWKDNFRVYSSYQLGLQDTFIRWLRQSYIPIGALDKTLTIAEPSKADEVSPIATGALFEMYLPIWDAAGKKLKRHEGNTPIYVLTNHLIDAQPIRMLTTPGKAVFMRRNADPSKTFAGWPYGEKLIREFNLHNNTRFSNYMIQYFGCTGEMCQPKVAVYLAPNNKLPIKHLTRGQVLDLIEKAIPAEIEREKKKLQSGYGHRPSSLAEEIERFEREKLPWWQNNLARLRNQYKNQLQQMASINNANGIEMINIFNGDDIFEERKSMYGIFTYEDDVLEKSKQDKPLWICISWQPSNMSQLPAYRELHRSMMEHFNFDYVYNFFFDPTKVKGKPYTILNAAAQKEIIGRLQKEKNTINTRVTKLPDGIHFFEDFSAAAIGQKPANWYFPNIGEKTIVTTPKGQDNEWVDLRTQKFTPTSLKRPLPENFKMEFDVMGNDFNTLTGGALRLTINNDEVTPLGDMKRAVNQAEITLSIVASNESNGTASGWIKLKTTYRGMPDKIRYAEEPIYSNAFSNRNTKVHIVITRQNNKITGFINNEEIIHVDKYKKLIPGFNELPAGTKLTHFNFEYTASQKENHIYIDNIKITTL